MSTKSDYADLLREWDARQTERLAQMTCNHMWTTPSRANNRFGRRSTALYETRCTVCGKIEVRSGKARLVREVIDA